MEMKKKRFASYMLTGKVATLPFMINSSFADVVPTYTEALSESVSVIETPATGVRLMTTTVSAGASSTYGGTDAAICSTSMPTTMNVVITGAHPGNTVFLVASSDKDDSFMQTVNPNIRVGTVNMTIVSSFSLGDNPITEEAGAFSQSTSPISIPVDLSKLQLKNLFTNGKFYLQAVIFSTMNQSTMWQTARVSELDEIVVGTAGCPSTYGGSTYGGSTY